MSGGSWSNPGEQPARSSFDIVSVCGLQEEQEQEQITGGGGGGRGAGGVSATEEVSANDSLTLFSFFSFFSSSFSLVSVQAIMLAAVCDGDAKDLAELMRQDPGFKVNMELNENGWTLLHHACYEDSRSAVIPLLLAHPAIDVNLLDIYGCSPFYYACVYGRAEEAGLPSCVREMLKDSRVNVNEPNKGGRTPLRCAAGNGHLEIIRWWIASGREVDLGKPGDVGKTDAIGVAKEWGKKEVVTLLERFKSDAAKTRSEVRMELGINGQYYSDYSILFLFLFSSFLILSLLSISL